MAKLCYVLNASNDNKPHLWGSQAPCSNTTSSSQIVPCCNPGDACGADGFCHFTHAQDDPVTGYYLGGCTDPKFEDPACPQHCTSYGTQDVIYTPDNGLWACCWGSGELDCRQPSNETFAAPGPEALFAVGTASASSSASRQGTTAKATASSTVASTTSSTLPAAAASSSARNPSSSDNTTTTIATAVTVPVVVILAAVLGIFLWRKKQRRRRGSKTSENAVDASHHQQQQYQSEQPNMAPAPKIELPADRERSELFAKALPTMRASELQG